MRKLITICLALIGLGLGGAVVAQTIGSVSNGYIEEGNLVRPGNIIKTITMSNRGQKAAACRKACDADSGCGAYSYVQKAPNRKPVCHLRLIALPRGAKRDHGYTQAISGTKLSLLPDVLKITPYPGRVIQNGVEMGKFKVDNQDPMACADACYRNGNCSGFTYKPRTVLPKREAAQCTLLSKNGTLSTKTQAGYLSGSKSPMSVPRKTLPGRSPKASPAVRPTLNSRSRPVIQRPEQSITIPDKSEEENPSLSDDDDAEFPGEMLQPDGR